MQIVYLSARPSVLAGTVAAVKSHLRFIDSILVVCPQVSSREVEALGVSVITDEELLGSPAPIDHQSRNRALRAALARRDEVEDIFLASDDDSRPLLELGDEVYVSRGRYRRYTFGWLDDWEHRSTSFDLGQLASRQLLGLLGFPRRSYASHMPQVIDKTMLGEVEERIGSFAARHPLCEWAMYFNVAPQLHPDRFEAPEPYLTLGWPENLSSWQPALEPAAFQFENYFAEHYESGAVFAGIDPEDLSLETAAEKVVRWRSYELGVLAGEAEPSVGKPPSEPAFAAGLRRARAVTVGDPLKRERQQNALLAAVRRAVRRG